MGSAKPRGPSRGRRLRGGAREASILSAAGRLFVRRGYPGLTMRDVAAAAGTTVGNVQYYFPTKERLLRALLERTAEGFLADFAGIRADPARTAEQKLVAFLECIVDAFPTEPKARFWPEFWALSNHNARAAAVLEEVYERGLATLRGILREIDPSRDERDVAAAALTILGSVEGLVVFVGHRRPWAESLPDVRRLAISSALHVARGRTPPLPRRRNA